jgi:mRNA-degrading endonuclease RelE of RelBE toxin-antitoxin system
MNVEISKAFVKDANVLSKKIKLIIFDLIKEIQSNSVKSPFDIKECFKLKGFNNLYKIRRGIYRVTLEYSEGKALLKRVLPRGQVYKKHNL